MISSNEMEKGLTVDIEGEPYTVLEWQHVEEGRASANIRMKLRHLRTGAIIERTLDAGHKFRLVPVDRHRVTFMFWDGEFYHFLDNDTQDETLIPPETLGEARKYIIDDLQLDLLLLDDEPVAVELPESVRGIYGTSVSCHGLKHGDFCAYLQEQCLFTCIFRGKNGV